MSPTDPHRRARDLIERFDADFDVPLAHHLAIGELETLAAFSPSAPLDIRVGAAWCRLVQADVRYELDEGLRLIDRSRPMAEALAARSSLTAFEQYVAARWFDGAGRLHYRCTDQTTARLYFARAEALAPIHCLADVTSNGLRARYEERRIAGDDEAKLVAPMLDALERFKALPAAAVGEGHRWREHRRGLCNLWHNLSVVFPKVNRAADAPQASQVAEAIARELNDAYRLAQTLLQQALTTRDGARSRALFEEMAGLGWVRGQRIARQNLAKLDRQAGVDNPEQRTSRYRQSLLTLLDLLKEANIERAELDHDFFAYTVAALELLLDPIKTPGIEAALGDHLGVTLAQLDRLQLDVIRRLRRVVKIGHYKVAFARQVEPRYRLRIARALAEIAPAAGESAERMRREEALAFVEEASSRELLDVLAAAPPPAATTTTTPLAWDEVAADAAGGRRGTLRRGTPLTAETRAAFDERRAWYEGEALRQPVTSQPHDPEIAHRIRMFTASQPGLTLLRFYRHADRAYGAFVFRDGTITHADLPDAADAIDAARQLIDEDRDEEGRLRQRPSDQVAALLSQGLLAPVWPMLQGPTPMQRLVIVPTGPIFDLPLHIAFEPGTRWPLMAAVPLCFSVSATAYVSRGRHLLARQPTEPDDDLCALLCLDGAASGRELLGVNWNPQQFHIAGAPPAGLRPGTFNHLGAADWAGIEGIVREKPEFLVYAGHGLAHPELASLSTGGSDGAGLKLDGDLLTQFDVGLRLRLPRNKLTVLGACLTGRGTANVGGEVAGFIRAFMLAGSGAIATTLWPVEDEAMVATCGYVLKHIAQAVEERTSFSIVELLHQSATLACRRVETAQERIEGCPLVLYL